MNNEQVKYLLSRVSKIVSEKEVQIHENNRLKVVTLSDYERFNLIKAGKVKMYDNLDKTNKSYNLTDIRFFFDFSEFEQLETFDNKKIKKERLKLHKEADLIRDSIVLRDVSFDYKSAFEKLENFGGNA